MVKNALSFLNPVYPLDPLFNESLLKVMFDNLIFLFLFQSVKCLFDEENNEGVLVTSTNELLQGLDIEVNVKDDLICNIISNHSNPYVNEK